VQKVELEQVSVRFSEILLLVQRLAQQQLELAALKAREKDAVRKERAPARRFPTMPRSGRR
jgi:hypothetical protein